MDNEENILKQCRKEARRMGLKIYHSNEVGLFIIADAVNRWAVCSPMSIYNVRDWLKHYEA